MRANMSRAFLLLLCWLSASVQAATSGYPLTIAATSVEGGKSHLFATHFALANGAPAAGETVTFANDACGAFPNGSSLYTTTTDATGYAAALFTAYANAGITCWLTARAGAALVNFDVVTYKMSQIAVIATASPLAPEPGKAFHVQASVRLGLHSLRDVTLAARIVPGTGNASLPETSLNTGLGDSVGFLVAPSGTGDFDVEVSFGALTKRLAIHYAAPFDYQDMWWSGPAENGWGMSVLQHGDTLFSTLFAYDAAGQPTWFVMPGGTWNAARTVFSGPVYSPRGSPWFAYDASRFASGAPVGTFTLTFAGPEQAVLDYVIGGVAGRKALTRQAFARAARTGEAPLEVDDLWWGGSAQNGWGIAVLKQDAALFSVWYTYDAAGAPTWFVLPGGQWSAPGLFEGRIFRTTGSRWVGAAYDAAALRATDAGSFRLRFSGAAAVLEYSLDGRTGSLPLARQPF